jgi:sulfur-oxidizing protein SoxY
LKLSDWEWREADLNITRRDALALTGALGAGFGWPGGAVALEVRTQDAIAAFTGGASADEGGIELEIADLVEDGARVPVVVRCEGAAAIALISDINPYAEIATFRFGPLAGSRRVETYIRLAGSQELVVLARMEDGSFRQLIHRVPVTVGRCA